MVILVIHPQLTFFNNSSPILEMLRQHVVWDYINSENSCCRIQERRKRRQHLSYPWFSVENIWLFEIFILYFVMGSWRNGLAQMSYTHQVGGSSPSLPTQWIIQYCTGWTWKFLGTHRPSQRRQGRQHKTIRVNRARILDHANHCASVSQEFPVGVYLFKYIRSIQYQESDNRMA